MSKLWRLIAILSPLLLSIGCSVTHPRVSTGMDKYINKPQRIAILRPQIDARVKYIDTPEFFRSRSYSESWETNIATGIRRSLEKDRHKVFHYLEVSKMLPRGKRQVELLNNRLVALCEPAIIADADYSKETVPILVTAEGLIPKELEDQVDLIIAVQGRAKIETIREFYRRWFRNIGFNLLTFPITAASAFIPVPLPISVTISTSVFEPSPEDCFVAMIIIDVKTKKIVYQNDYFHTTNPSDDTELQELGNDLMESFRRPEEDD